MEVMIKTTSDDNKKEKEISVSSIAIGFNVEGKVHPLVAKPEDLELLQQVIATTLKTIGARYTSRYEFKIEECK